MKLVLSFKGPAELRSAALARLHRQFPGVILTPKTDTLVEAQLNASQASSLRAEANSEWEAFEPTSASFEPPALDLAKLGKHFGF